MCVCVCVCACVVTYLNTKFSQELLTGKRGQTDSKENIHIAKSLSYIL